MIEKKKPCIVIDSREQMAWDFSPYIGDEWTVATGTLTHADYSIQSLSDMISLERKSLQDIVMCCGSERDRFVRELLALRGYKCKAVIIEASMSEIDKGGWRGKVTPSQVTGSMASWMVKYNIPFICACNHELAAKTAFTILRKYYEFCQDYSKRFNGI